VLRIGGQVRTDWGNVTGWDFGAALAMARAGGISEAAVYEFLPWIEAKMVAGIAASRKTDDDTTET
jgi:hypothetical protein